MKPEQSKYADENILWTQFREGDQQAFAKLFRDFSERLYRYGIKFVQDEELVKDSIQELFIRLHQNRSKLPDVVNPLFYLFQTLKNILIDALRQREKITYLSSEEIPFHVHFEYNDTGGEEDSESIKEQFDHVLSLLSERQKEAIYLRYSAEMSYEEIATLLNINYQSTRNLIHRAMEKIRSEINPSLFLSMLV
ncbi:MAG: sigma-70 family RNA polymerase sigma factor [Tannerellaceae bacterium]|nr:sigma-70 family RNA polymerase sigma factor [Tannerellaceae bacterium]